MKLTGMTITNTQIRDLRGQPPTLDDVRPRGAAALELVVRGFELLCDDALDSPDVRLRGRARSRCAEILNARTQRNEILNAGAKP